MLESGTLFPSQRTFIGTPVPSDGTERVTRSRITNSTVEARAAETGADTEATLTVGTMRREVLGNEGGADPDLRGGPTLAPKRPRDRPKCKTSTPADRSLAQRQR